MSDVGARTARATRGFDRLAELDCDYRVEDGWFVVERGGVVVEGERVAATVEAGPDGFHRQPRGVIPLGGEERRRGLKAFPAGIDFLHWENKVRP